MWSLSGPNPGARAPAADSGGVGKTAGPALSALPPGVPLPVRLDGGSAAHIMQPVILGPSTSGGFGAPPPSLLRADGVGRMGRTQSWTARSALLPESPVRLQALPVPNSGDGGRAKYVCAVVPGLFPPFQEYGDGGHFLLAVIGGLGGGFDSGSGLTKTAFRLERRIRLASHRRCRRESGNSLPQRIRR